MTAGRVLTLNVGSSSVKFAVYVGEAADPVFQGQVSGIGARPRLKARTAEGDTVEDQWPEDLDFEGVLLRTLEWLAARPETQGVTAVGHRIVHGGLDFREPAWLDGATLQRLSDLVPLAPLHQPFNLAGVRLASQLFPQARQAAVFDTAFHADQPRIARLYGLPRALIDDGIIAYGFHGLSYAYITDVLRSEEGPAAGGRAIILHLGSGVSLCAVRDGRSVATTMGFSALEGPPMSTRSGSLDPGVVLHLIQARGMSAEAVTDMLYHRSGLLGVSGVSGDMVTLLASDAPAAREALALYAYRIAREIGSLAAALGGVDTMVFTAGVGENAAAIRQAVCEQCAWLGVQLDDAANLAHARRISRPDSAVTVMVIPTDEQLIIARGVQGLGGSR